MKTILLLLCLCSSVYADEWGYKDSYREAIYLTLHAIDYAQTRNIARMPDCHAGQLNQVPSCTYEQFNTILGTHPSVDRVDAYFVIAALANVAISYALPKDWRHGFQYVSIGFEAGMVHRNRLLGISARF